VLQDLNKRNVVACIFSLYPSRETVVINYVAYYYAQDLKFLYEQLP